MICDKNFEFTVLDILMLIETTTILFWKLLLGYSEIVYNDTFCNWNHVI